MSNNQNSTGLRGIRKLLLVLIPLTAAVVVSGYFYYRSINHAEDPRTLFARKSMTAYSDLVGQGEYAKALKLLDNAREIYRGTPGYADSFEIGVVHNNRGAIYLIQAETAILTGEPPEGKEAVTRNLTLAHRFITRGIDIYTQWIDSMGNLTETEIQALIAPFFDPLDPVLKGVNLNAIIRKRVDDIRLAQVETPRRMSVSLTNLGIVCRYEGDVQGAQDHYEEALRLWPDNHVAGNNLNRLLGRPVEERGILRQLFPKDRKAPDNYIDPKYLTRIDKVLLKETLSLIVGFQNKLGNDFKSIE